MFLENVSFPSLNFIFYIKVQILLFCEIVVKLLLVMPHKISRTIMASGASVCWPDCANVCIIIIIRGKTGLLRQNEQIYGLKVRCLEEMWMNHEGSCKLQ